MPSDADRLKSGLSTLIQWTLGARIIQRIDYLALYPCRVISQNGDGTLELLADDDRVGTPSGVPIRYGVPGISATVPSGSRCYMTFGGGNPQKPIVVDWESGTVLTLYLGGSSDFAVKGSTLKTALDNLDSAWITFLTGLSTGNLSARASIMSTSMSSFVSAISSMLSTVVKIG